MLRAQPNTRILRRGSSKAVPSQIGRPRAPCCGSMENVCHLVLRWFSLTESFVAGSGKTILRHVARQLVLFVRRIAYPIPQLCDHPRYRTYLERCAGLDGVFLL